MKGKGEKQRGRGAGGGGRLKPLNNRGGNHGQKGEEKCVNKGGLVLGFESKSHLTILLYCGANLKERVTRKSEESGSVPQDI